MQETLTVLGCKFTMDLVFLKKKTRQGCTTQKSGLGMQQHRIQNGNAQMYFKFIPNLFHIKLGLAWVHFPKIIRFFWWHGTWLRTCSENHTHASPRGSKGAITLASKLTRKSFVEALWKAVLRHSVRSIGFICFPWLTNATAIVKAVSYTHLTLPTIYPV